MFTTIVTNPILSRFTEKQVEAFSSYGGSFVMETCVPEKADGTGKFTEDTFLLYYNKEKHPQGSNWYIIGIDRYGKFYIADGERVIKSERFHVDVVGNYVPKPKIGNLYGFFSELKNEPLYSLYRHDARSDSKACIIVDGGRDYTRLSVSNDGDCGKYRKEHGYKFGLFSLTDDGKLIFTEEEFSWLIGL